MPRDATVTRLRIMDAAERLILSRGFGGTSIDAILEQTDVTKGAFFHHFRTKGDLAFAVMERFADMDRNLLDRLLEKARKLSRDPLQQLLIIMGLYEDLMVDMDTPSEGCLFASYGYEAGLFDQRTLDLIEEALLRWQRVVAELIRAAMEKHAVRLNVSADELAMNTLTTFEGAHMLSKSLKDPKLVAQQLRHHRNYLELLFDVV